MLDDLKTIKQIETYLEQNGLNDVEPHWGEWVERKKNETRSSKAAVDALWSLTVETIDTFNIVSNLLGFPEGDDEPIGGITKPIGGSSQ